MKSRIGFSVIDCNVPHSSLIKNVDFVKKVFNSTNHSGILLKSYIFHPSNLAGFKFKSPLGSSNLWLTVTLQHFVRYTHNLGTSKHLKTNWKHHLIFYHSNFSIFGYFLSFQLLCQPEFHPVLPQADRYQLWSWGMQSWDGLGWQLSGEGISGEAFLHSSIGHIH